MNRSDNLQNMIDAFRSKIDELEEVDTTVTSSTDDNNYIQKVIRNVDSSLRDNGISQLTYDQDDNNLYITVGDTLTEYQVPFNDLSFDDKDIAEDGKYIVDEIISSYNR